MSITVRKYLLKDSKREALYLDIYNRGERDRESLGMYLTGDREQDSQTRKLAELIASKRRLELAEKGYNIRTTRRQGGDFVSHMKKIAEKKNYHDAGVWRRAVAHLTAYGGASITFRQLTPTFVEGFKNRLLETLKPGSAWAYWRKIVSGCRRAVDDGILSQNPTARIKFRKPEAEREFLTPEEVQQLAATPCPSAEVREVFLFACYCGLRWSDLKALTWDQVRVNGDELEIVLVQAKTDEPVRVPLHKTAVAILEGRTREGLVFKMPAQQTFDKAVRRWTKAAGLTKVVSIHVARHTYATMLLNQGVDLYVVSKLLGHRSLETTKVYVKLLDASKRRAVDKLPSLQMGNKE